MKIFVTGCAGFLGSHLTERLIAQGHCVYGYDNLSTGYKGFLNEALASKNFIFTRGDLLDRSTMCRAMAECEMVYHLAANADVRHGLENPERDKQQNIFGTANVLECMRKRSIKRIAFTSTGSVYGHLPAYYPGYEDGPMPVQTSLYGASKLAAEGMISAYCYGYGMTGHIFRLVSLLGERYTHGHVIDFTRQLSEHPSRLKVLGNGMAVKSYLYVRDCVDAILLAAHRPRHAFLDPVQIFNLGQEHGVTTRENINTICRTLRVSPAIEYGEGESGWVGDNPYIVLSTSRIRHLGWRPSVSISEAVERTVRWLVRHPDILEP